MLGFLGLVLVLMGLVCYGVILTLVGIKIGFWYSILVVGLLVLAEVLFHGANFVLAKEE